MDRRKLLTLVGAGWLTAKMAPLSEAQTAQESADEPQQDNTNLARTPPNLIELAHPVATTSGGLDKTYFWRDDRTLLFLRRTPDQPTFHAALVDAVTGQSTLPEQFNAAHSAKMQGRPMIVSIEGSPERKRHYRPPMAALSPDRKWLLWRNFPFTTSRWIAATFDGQQQEWTPGTDPASEATNLPNHAYWLPDGTGWVELVDRYSDRTYSMHIAHEYRLGKADPVRTISITGLQDGLSVGVRHDGVVVMYHPIRDRDAVSRIDLSCVDLSVDTATAQPLSLPVPVCDAVLDMTLSSQGDRLAWVLQQKHEDTRLYTLYVADADGANARPVATAEDVRIGKGYSWPREVRWLPDGKQVSFVYADTLYTIPV